MDWLINAEKYFHQGGPIMYPLVLLSLLLWAMIGERLYFFKKNNLRGITPEEVLQILLENKPINKRAKEQLCPRMLMDLRGQLGKDSGLDCNLLHQQWLQKSKQTKQGLSLLTALAAAAPLLGLFGTVLGMINTFEVISVFGTGNARALASGISEALVSTQTGLLVGIPALLMCYFLRQQARRLESRLRRTRLLLQRRLER